MIYLVKYTNKKQKVPLPAEIDKFDRWCIIDKICDGNSVLDINKYLMRKELPIINSMELVRLDGIMLVYSLCTTEQLYILDTEVCINLLRELKIKELLNE